MGAVWRSWGGLPRQLIWDNEPRGIGRGAARRGKVSASFMGTLATARLVPAAAARAAEFQGRVVVAAQRLGS